MLRRTVGSWPKGNFDDPEAVIGRLAIFEDTDARRPHGDHLALTR